MARRSSDNLREEKGKSVPSLFQLRNAVNETVCSKNMVSTSLDVCIGVFLLVDDSLFDGIEWAVMRKG